MQRRALGMLFLAIAVVLLAVAVASATEGGRAWVIAVAAACLGLWIGDLGRKALRQKR